MDESTERNTETAASENLKSEADLLSDLFSSTITTDNGSSRISQYKCRIREESNQETRRRKLLQQQKDSRSAKFNQQRNVEVKQDSKWSNEEQFIEKDEGMEWSSIKTVAWHKQNTIYNKMLTFSEWLVDVPDDFTSKWIMVPCPVGKRTLLVSKPAHTVSYSKKGVALYYFKSNLPANSILDCIYCFKTKSFYVIDVIQWNGMSFVNCQTDFRFYWLETKFQENPEYSTKSNKNHYPIIKLQRCTCNHENISQVANNYPIFPNGSPELDGLLFYHSETSYTAGTTPLIGWLKMFMVPDVFGLTIAAEYNEEKPQTYKNFKQFMKEKFQRKKLFKDKSSYSKKMECEESTTDKNESTDQTFTESYCTTDENTMDNISDVS